MYPRPQSLALSLCDYVIIEEHSRKISLIGSLTRMAAQEFPHSPAPFFVTAVLWNSLGDGTISLRITEWDTDEEIYAKSRRVRFSDRLAQLHVIFRVAECTFPAEGEYILHLQADGVEIARRRLQVILREAK